MNWEKLTRVGARNALGGENVRWEQTGDSEPINAGLKGSGEPLKDAQQGSDIITSVFFLFLKDLLTFRLWQLKNKKKRL